MSARRRLRNRYPIDRDPTPENARSSVIDSIAPSAKTPPPPVEEPQPKPEPVIEPTKPVPAIEPPNPAPEPARDPEPDEPPRHDPKIEPEIEVDYGAIPPLDPERPPGWALAHRARALDPAVEAALAAADAEATARAVAASHARGRRRHRLTALALGFFLPILAFVTGLLLFNSLVMPRLIHGVSEVKVPDLSNLNLDQAEQALTAANLQLSRAGERFDPAVPTGFVLSQDPPAGTPVRGRRRVSVVVSLGEEYSSVPELFGESERGALVLLKNSGLRAGGFTRATSDEVGEGLVVATDPPAASVLNHDTPIALLISTGQGEESFVMPDLLGREIGGVRRQLEALGFRVLTPPAAPSIGTIVSQNPGPGSRITRDTPIVVHATGRMIR
jgi:beta-lactam-binding protein with PASTA domain